MYNLDMETSKLFARSSLISFGLLTLAVFLFPPYASFGFLLFIILAGVVEIVEINRITKSPSSFLGKIGRSILMVILMVLWCSILLVVSVVFTHDSKQLIGSGYTSLSSQLALLGFFSAFPLVITGIIGGVLALIFSTVHRNRSN
jgi:energy-coupling factor transporter transmembrane protein EcfT